MMLSRDSGSIEASFFLSFSSSSSSSFPNRPCWQKEEKGQESWKRSCQRGWNPKRDPLEQTRGSKATRAQWRRGGEVIEAALKRWPQVPNWNPLLVLKGGPLPLNSSIRDFDNERTSYVANFMEQALFLPQDMAVLCNLKKHEMFLSLKRDLALVCWYPSFLTQIYACILICLLLMSSIANSFFSFF